MALRTPSEAVAYATTVLNTGYNGMCLAHVQDSYGATPVDPSAQAAWYASRYQHPTTDLASAPYGAPIYWSQSGNPYGHIAIHLDGDRMYTTDSGVGHPHEDSISKWENLYGYRPLGWTEDIENQLIPELGDEDMALSSEDIQKIANAVAGAVWSYTYDQSKGTTYNRINYDLDPQTIAQAVWGFLASDGKNLQPNGNPYETLKTSGQLGGFAFTVDDDEHNDGRTVYWLNVNTMKVSGYASWDEWKVWCRCMHCPTDKYAKLTAEEFDALKSFVDREPSELR